MKPKKVWRLIVTLTDQPEGDEDYITKEQVINYVNDNPEAGIEIKVVEAKDMGTL